jgi:hypothetical protein
MLHACLHTIFFVFCYTSWSFYAFYRTNLLTRYHSASSLFLLFLCFRKATQEIFSELDETKSQPSIFTEASRRPKMRRRGARGSPHPRVVWPRPWPHHQGVSRPGPPPDDALSPISSPWREKPREREDPGALPGTLPERGIPARGLLHHNGHLRSDVWVVYLRLRVHSSS